jgi:hypothetical protein
MNDINTGVADAVRLLEEERINIRRARVRKCMRNYRSNNPEIARERMREYMRTSGCARNYYNANREVILAKKREEYARKKAEREEEETARRFAALNV